MDLPENWEKKALIVLGAVFLILIIYAYNPFQTNSNVTTNNQSPNSVVPVPFPQKTTNNSANLTTKLTAEQAKNIVSQNHKGYTVGEPTQGSIVINGISYVVWIVPISNNTATKNIFIDANTGIILNVTL